MQARFESPPRWSDERLEAMRRQATADFVVSRLQEGSDRYRPTLARCREAVGRLFEATNNLRALPGGAALAADASLLTPARYLGGPPVSEDDLDTLADAKVAKRRRLDRDLATTAATVIETALDQDRFPWLFESPPRDPTPLELDVAVQWTAGLWASQAVQTARRGESSARQEAAVAAVLDDAGFELMRVPLIDVTAANLRPGQYCRETLVVGAKCDIPVMLRDSRLLLIECKVSNSGLNSVKRLIRETAGKADLWNRLFGERALPAAVLSGVFKTSHLMEAQNTRRVAIFWERDLSPLREFLDRAGSR